MADYVRGAITHPGLKRDKNEDFFGYFPAPHGTLAVVCDGMGGMGGGWIASKAAVSAMEKGFRSNSALAPDQLLLELTRQANVAIAGLRAEHREVQNMGTTFVAALICDDKLYYTHAGDSRLYLIRPGEIIRMTKDDTPVQQLVDEGLISPSEAADHPKAHIVNKALGHLKERDFYDAIHELDLLHGDTLILTTDGLTGFVGDQTLYEVITRSRPSEAADRLLDMVLRLGAPDNITFQIIRNQIDPSVPPKAQTPETLEGPYPTNVPEKKFDIPIELPEKLDFEKGSYWEAGLRTIFYLSLFGLFMWLLIWLFGVITHDPIPPETPAEASQSAKSTSPILQFSAKLNLDRQLNGEG